MVTVNQNYFNINFDYILPTFNHKSLLDRVQKYVTLYKEINALKNTLKSYFDNIDNYLLINKLNSVDKIDEVLINLEDLSEFANEILDNQELKRWYNAPLSHALNKLEDRNIALQGLLLSKQAHIKHASK
ncbi:MAG: hypothetical protein KU38_08075 [Sulfurovum sp. FS08-3]|nr:MAG: hypothetical protein KU38_08075 [Sulfurovum sp. FS08-3]